MANTYVAGTLVRVQGVFTTLATGAPVNPTTTTLKYAITVSGVTGATITVPGASLTNPITGTFQYNIDTTAAPGYYEYEFIGTGTGQSAGVNSFLVDALPL